MLIYFALVIAIVLLLTHKQIIFCLDLQRTRHLAANVRRQLNAIRAELIDRCLAVDLDRRLTYESECDAAKTKANIMDLLDRINRADEMLTLHLYDIDSLGFCESHKLAAIAAKLCATKNILQRI